MISCLLVLIFSLSNPAWASPRAKAPPLSGWNIVNFLSPASSPPPTPTIPHGIQNHHNVLIPRAGVSSVSSSSSSTSLSPTATYSLPPTLVNLFTMPTCSGISSLLSDDCTNPSPGDLPCPLVDIPCLDDSATNCSTYTQSCYCDLVTPLTCAWSCPSWFTWLQDEDWFANVCPSVQPVDFSALPDCASDCIQSSSIDYGCITGGRNCFCLHESLFNCPSSGGCSSDDEASIASWFAEECNITQETATEVVQGGALPSTSAVIVTTGKKSGALHWYEIFVIVVAGVSFGSLAIGALIWR